MSGASGGVGSVRGILGASRDSRYSGTRRGIWGIGAPGGVGAVWGIRGCRGVSGVLGASRDSRYSGTRRV